MTHHYRRELGPQSASNPCPRGSFRSPSPGLTSFLYWYEEGSSPESVWLHKSRSKHKPEARTQIVALTAVSNQFKPEKAACLSSSAPNGFFSGNRVPGVGEIGPCPKQEDRSLPETVPRLCVKWKEQLPSPYVFYFFFQANTVQTLTGRGHNPHYVGPF